MNPTFIEYKDGKIYVYRFINRKRIKIEFNGDVLAKDLESYFSINDDLFAKMGVRD